MYVHSLLAADSGLGYSQSSTTLSRSIRFEGYWQTKFSGQPERQGGECPGGGGQVPVPYGPGRVQLYNTLISLAQHIEHNCTFFMDRLGLLTSNFSFVRHKAFASTLLANFSYSGQNRISAHNRISAAALECYFEGLKTNYFEIFLIFYQLHMIRTFCKKNIFKIIIRSLIKKAI